MDDTQIQKKIQSYGYVTVESSAIALSMYTITDDQSIITVAPYLNSIIKLTGTKYTTNIENRVNVYTPKSLRVTNAFMPTPMKPEDIVDSDVSYTVENQPTSVFHMSDGSTIKIRVVVTQIKKTRRYNTSGEFIYLVNSSYNVEIIPAPQ